MDKFGTEVSVFGPDIKQIIEPPMVPGVLLPIVGCSVPEQVHNEWLQGSAHRGEGRRSVQVILAVVEQIIEEIEYVEPSTLGRRFGASFIEGACQRDQVFGQPAYPVRRGSDIVK